MALAPPPAPFGFPLPPRRRGWGHPDRGRGWLYGGRMDGNSTVRIGVLGYGNVGAAVVVLATCTAIGYSFDTLAQRLRAPVQLRQPG